MKSLAKLGFMIFFLFAVCEGTVRLFGYHPWNPAKLGLTGGWYQPDSEIGWVRTTTGVGPVVSKKVTGETVTGEKTSRAEEVFVLGCSFVEGAGLRQAQTFTGKLQARHPELNFANLGTGGYSTYQALLLLKRVLAGIDSPPRAVLYGFVDFHEFRNVALAQWVSGLAWSNSTGTIAIPYCGIGRKGDLECYPSRKYPLWPWRTALGLVPFMEQTYLMLQDFGKRSQMEAVSVYLAKKMQETAENAGSKFRLVYLASVNGPKERYLELFQRAGIKVLDCVFPQAHLPKYTLPNDGHPNELLNDIWTDCVERGLQEAGVLKEEGVR